MAVHEVTSVLQMVISKTASRLRHSSSLVPMLYLLKKGSPMEVGADVPGIVDAQNQGTEPGDDKDTVYRSVIMLDFKGDLSETAKLASRLVRLHDPDSVTLIFKAYYNEYKNNEPEDISLDPTSINVLYIICYIKGESKPILKLIPILDRGEKESVIPGEDEPCRDVCFGDGAWTRNFRRVRPPIPNPYTYKP